MGAFPEVQGEKTTKKSLYEVTVVWSIWVFPYGHSSNNIAQYSTVGIAGHTAFVAVYPLGLSFIMNNPVTVFWAYIAQTCVLNRKYKQFLYYPWILRFPHWVAECWSLTSLLPDFMCYILMVLPAKRPYLFFLFMYTAIDKQCSVLAITNSEGINYSYIKNLAMIECLKNDKHKCKKQILINGGYKSVHIFTSQRLICKILSLEEIWIPNAPQALPMFAVCHRLTFRKCVLIFPQSLPLCSFAEE